MQDSNKKENKEMWMAIVGTIIIFMFVVILSKMVFLRNDFWILGVVSILPSIIGGAIGCEVSPTGNEENWWYCMTSPVLLVICFSITVIVIFFTSVIFNLQEWIIYASVDFVCFYVNAGMCAIFGD